jgi:sortase A
LSVSVTTATTRSDHRASRARRWSLASVAIGTTLFAGITTLLYPTAAAWFSDRAHSTEVSGYVAAVDEAGASVLDSLLDAAEEYNDNLPEGPLRDPYTLNAQGQSDNVRDGWDVYLRQLALGEDEPMARIRIPRIAVDLPIYHGTDDATLDRGIGHLYGSGLPVGGSGSHSVLTGHSGLPSATLFTHLDQLERGDLFYIDVVGEQLAYEVDQIKVVDPDDGDDLRQSPGHDYVTLLTCTPTGVNSHRLLVRGERIELPRSEAGTIGLPANATDPGFPWWVFGLSAGLICAAFVMWPRRPGAPAPSRP